jgi:hypothetical protein
MKLFEMVMAARHCYYSCSRWLWSGTLWVKLMSWGYNQVYSCHVSCGLLITPFKVSLFWSVIGEFFSSNLIDMFFSSGFSGWMVLHPSSPSMCWKDIMFRVPGGPDHCSLCRPLYAFGLDSCLYLSKLNAENEAYTLTNLLLLEMKILLTFDICSVSGVLTNIMTEFLLLLEMWEKPRMQSLE